MPEIPDGPAMRPAERLKRGGGGRLDDAMPDWLRPPPDTPEYMLPAWLGSLHYTLGDEGIVAAFRAETGNQWKPGKAPIERTIDKATGAEERFFREFVAWNNLRVWGPIDGSEVEAHYDR